MSEYIEIQTEFGDDGRTLFVTTNLLLAEDALERYETPAQMEEGSPLAQALSLVAGIAQLTLHGRSLTIIRQPEIPWHHIVADLSAALKDFFL